MSARTIDNRTATKAANRKLAEAMRAAGLRPAGEAWQLAKRGVPLSQIAGNAVPACDPRSLQLAINLKGEQAADWDAESLAELAGGEYGDEAAEWADSELVRRARRAGYRGSGLTRAALLDAWRESVEAQYLAAEEACNGVLLTREASAAGVSARSLFTGPARRAAAHASDELKWWWADHPRPTFAAWLGNSDARNAAAVSF